MIGFTSQFIALRLFRSVGEQSDARWVLVEHLGSKNAAHQGKLHKMKRLAIDIAPDIKDNRLVNEVGNDRRNRRSVDAGNPLQHEHAGRHGGTGVAGTDHGIGITAFKKFKSDTNR